MRQLHPQRDEQGIKYGLKAVRMQGRQPHPNKWFMPFIRGRKKQIRANLDGVVLEEDSPMGLPGRRAWTGGSLQTGKTTEPSGCPDWGVGVFHSAGSAQEP